MEGMLGPRTHPGPRRWKLWAHAEPTPLPLITPHPSREAEGAGWIVPAVRVIRIWCEEPSILLNGPGERESRCRASVGGVPQVLRLESEIFSVTPRSFWRRRHPLGVVFCNDLGRLEQPSGNRRLLSRILNLLRPGRRAISPARVAVASGKITTLPSEGSGEECRYIDTGVAGNWPAPSWRGERQGRETKTPALFPCPRVGVWS
jgi:hypothetical protein